VLHSKNIVCILLDSQVSNKKKRKKKEKNKKEKVKSKGIKGGEENCFMEKYSIPYNIFPGRIVVHKN
jgi:hypothetical protein